MQRVSSPFNCAFSREQAMSKQWASKMTFKIDWLSLSFSPSKQRTRYKMKKRSMKGMMRSLQSTCFYAVDIHSVFNVFSPEFTFHLAFPLFLLFQHPSTFSPSAVACFLSSLVHVHTCAFFNHSKQLLIQSVLLILLRISLIFLIELTVTAWTVSQFPPVLTTFALDVELRLYSRYLRFFLFYFILACLWGWEPCVRWQR